MNTDGNLNALNMLESALEQAELILEHEQNELFICIESSINEINRQMSYHAKYSVMDKQEILKYVKETLENLLEVK